MENIQSNALESGTFERVYKSVQTKKQGISSAQRICADFSDL
jgi:hypothetical protein